MPKEFVSTDTGAAVTEWLSSWLAEQEDRGSILGLATWIFREWLSSASKSRYSWNTAESDVNPQYNQLTKLYQLTAERPDHKKDTYWILKALSLFGLKSFLMQV